MSHMHSSQVCRDERLLEGSSWRTSILQHADKATTRLFGWNGQRPKGCCQCGPDDGLCLWHNHRPSGREVLNARICCSVSKCALTLKACIFCTLKDVHSTFLKWWGEQDVTYLMHTYIHFVNIAYVIICIYVTDFVSNQNWTKGNGNSGCKHGDLLIFITWFSADR